MLGVRAAGTRVVLLAAAVGVVLAVTLWSSRGGAASPAAACPTQPTATVDLPGAPPALISNGFVALRRPAGAQDALPGGENERVLTEPAFERVYPAATRLLGRAPNGDNIYLLTGWTRPVEPVPARCLPKGWTRYAPLPRVASQLGFCLVDLRRTAGSYGARCAPFASVASGTEFIAYGPALALLPDAAAGVRLTYRDGEVVSAASNGNLVAYWPPAALLRQMKRGERRLTRRLHSQPDPHLTPRQLRRLLRQFARTLTRANPVTVTWLDAQGTEIRRLHPHLTASDGVTYVGEGGATVAFRPTPRG